MTPRRAVVCLFHQPLATALIWAAGVGLAPAYAGCSRPLEVPVAEVGLSVDFQGARVEGVFPQLLRELGAQLGCEMVFSQVPRARQQLAFDNGSADLLVPASRTAARDALGDFVPLVQVRPTLLSLGRSGPPLERLSDLLATPELRLVVVRGYEYGPVYRETIEQLRQQRRLSEEPNPAGVARALRTGLADLTLMSPNIFIGALVSDPGLTPLMAKLRVEPVAELGWNESGLYLSRARMSAEERQQLRDWFARASKSGRVWQVFNEIYPPHSLDGHMRPVN